VPSDIFVAIHNFRTFTIAMSSSELRNAFRAAKQINRVNHPLAAYDEAGKLRCTLCIVSIKSATAWIGHIASKGHKDAVENVKRGPSAPASGLKRTSSDLNDFSKEPALKKNKTLVSYQDESSDEEDSLVDPNLKGEIAEDPEGALKSVPDSQEDNPLPPDFFENNEAHDLVEVDDLIVDSSPDADLNPTNKPTDTKSQENEPSKLPKDFFDGSEQDLMDNQIAEFEEAISSDLAAVIQDPEASQYEMFETLQEKQEKNEQELQSQFTSRVALLRSKVEKNFGDGSETTVNEIDHVIDSDENIDTADESLLFRMSASSLGAWSSVRDSMESDSEEDDGFEEELDNWRWRSRKV
jgi:zinc finger protein 830